MSSKRVILIGKAASGKDYIRKIMESNGFTYCVSHTSRPKREGEIEGQDYYFISDDIDKSKFYEYVYFNNWFYGTSIEEFNKSNLFIMTPSGVSKLKNEDRLESYIVLIDIDDEIRRERLSIRNDSDSVERRLSADEKGFEFFFDFDNSIDDPEFKCDAVWCKPDFLNRKFLI